jgi:four helix bundle protein
MPLAFENLQVYQKAVDFADACCQLSGDFPRGYYFLQDQLNRAALSIATNLAEGNGRLTKADRKHFFSIARGSLQECVPLFANRHLLSALRHLLFANR